jgi:hypothetical protein
MVNPSTNHFHIEFEVTEVVNEVRGGANMGQCS